MLSADAKATLLLLVGIGLLLNPIYLAPGNLDGSGTEYTYEVAPVTNESVAESTVWRAEQTLRCGTERACALEETIAEEGALEYDGTIQTETRAGIWRWDPHSIAWNRYRLVTMDGDFYVPEQESTENGTLLTHEPVSTWEALEHIAVPSDRATLAVRTAVETGSVTVYDRPVPEFERNDPIEHDGEIYTVTGRASTWGGDEIVFGRILLFLGGAVAVGVAWRRRGRS